MPDRHSGGRGEAALAPTERCASRARTVQRLRALVVCLSFAVCLPAAGQWELTWPARAVASLVSAAVGSAALVPAAMGVGGLPRAGHAALAASSQLRGRARHVAPWASAGALPAPPCEQRNRAPGFDGRQLYLEQCTLTC